MLNLLNKISLALLTTQKCCAIIQVFNPLNNHIEHQKGGGKMGYRLSELRKERGMTQEKLAQVSGVGRVTIALIEAGTTKNVSSKTLLALAKALNITVDALFFDEAV